MKIGMEGRLEWNGGKLKRIKRKREGHEEGNE